MALKIFEKFSPRANPADTDYPYGSIKNESVPGAKDGTPLDASWGNDMGGFTDALLAEAGIEPNGNADTAVASQRLEALKTLHINDLSKAYEFDTITDAINSNIIFPAGKVIHINDGDTAGRYTATYDVFETSTVTPNSDDIVQSVAVPTQALVSRDVKNLAVTFPTVALMQSCRMLKSGYKITTYDNDLRQNWQITTTVTPTPVGTAGDLYAFEVQDKSVSELKTKLNLESKFLSSVNAFRGVDSGKENFQKARVINVLGDSISFGAGADTSIGGIPMNGWPRILGKMARAEFGGNQYGFATAVTDDGTGTELHEITLGGGTWTSLLGAAAGHLPNGWAQLSPAPGATHTCKVPSKYKKVRIWYDGTITGVYDVTINGNPAFTINSGSGNGLDYSDVIAAVDSGDGTYTIETTVVSGQLGICGYEYLDVNNAGVTPEFRVQNFSRDGRRGQDVSKNVIDEMAKGCYCLIWALGANDRTATGAELTAFNQRMDWLRDACIANSTKLIVLDMLYVDPDSNDVRAALRRVVDETPQAKLVPFPNMFTTSGVPPVSGYLISDLNWSYDGVHPTYIGHRMIAEACAEAVGLSCTSKLQAENFDSSWNPIDFEAYGLVTNGITDVHRISRYRFNNNTLEIYIATAAVPAPNAIFGKINLEGREVKDLRQYYTLPDGSGNTAFVSVASNGDLRYIVDPASPGQPAAINAFITVATSRVNNFLTYN